MTRDEARIIAEKIIKAVNENKNGDAGERVAQSIEKIYFQGWDDSVDHCISEFEKYRKGDDG